MHAKITNFGVNECIWNIKTSIEWLVDNTKIFCELSIQYIDRKIKLIFLKDNIKNYRIKEEKKKRDCQIAFWASVWYNYDVYVKY